MNSQNKVTLAGLFCAVGGFALGLAAYAQFDPNPELDPVSAAPHIYEVALENDYVRVIKTTARPGQIPPMHSHRGRAAIFVTPCTETIESADGTIEEVRFDAGTAVWAPAETHGGEPYAVAEECIFMEVEVKAATE